MLTCFEDIQSHWGHDIEAVTYGPGPVQDAVNAAIECVTCGVVLIDFDRVSDPVADPPLLTEPLTTAELRELAAQHEQGFIKVLVAVDDAALIGGNLESFLDLLSEKATGSNCLMEISYRPLGVEDGSLVYEVSGNPEMVLEMADADVEVGR